MLTVSRKKEINDMDYSLNYLEHGTVHFVGMERIAWKQRVGSHFPSVDQVPNVVETSPREYVIPSEVAMDTSVVSLGLWAPESCSMYSLKEGDELFYASKVLTLRPSVFLPLLITADPYCLIGWVEKGKFCPKKLGIGLKLSISHTKRLEKIASA